jgi:hypothetical protein
MMRVKNAILLVPFAVAAMLPMASSARVAKPVIRGAEIGYFGSATVTYKMSVFVYSNLGPRAGNRVTVCVRGTCKQARGHNARLNWYSASFSTRGLRMGDPVRFTVKASTLAGTSQVTVTKPLLCMHNNGSTPQT